MSELLLSGYLFFFAAIAGFFVWRVRTDKLNIFKTVKGGKFGPIHLIRQPYGEVILQMCGVTQGIDARTFVEDKSYWHKAAELVVEVGRSKKEKGKRNFAVLYLGLGGGTIPWLVNKELPEVRQVVIEIDSKVIQVVREDFELREIPTIEIREADAFELVSKKFDFKEQFDVVLVDVFSDFRSLDEPGSLQRGFLDYYHGLLKPGGLFMVNQPAHTKAAKESVQKVEQMLSEKYGQTRTVFVHDRKRDFRNCLVMV